jgi:hypothetical protein
MKKQRRAQKPPSSRPENDQWPLNDADWPAERQLDAENSCAHTRLERKHCAHPSPPDHTRNAALRSHVLEHRPRMLKTKRTKKKQKKRKRTKKKQKERKRHQKKKKKTQNQQEV